jgi:hypothetical protein
MLEAIVIRWHCRDHRVIRLAFPRRTPQEIQEIDVWLSMEVIDFSIGYRKTFKASHSQSQRPRYQLTRLQLLPLSAFS